jgi:hypothetical protein
MAFENVSREELIRENLNLKERLYRVHTVDHPDVRGCLAGINHPDDLEVYDQRAQFRGEATKQTLRASELEGMLGGAVQRLDKMEALARDLWAKLHDLEKEPFPEV